VVGGIIPPADAEALIKRGVARVYTPKDFDLTRSCATSSPWSTGAWKEAA
jgi:(2R)-ethylmalonyl-CoA mutase